MQKNCKNDFAPLKSVNLCPCTVSPRSLLSCFSWYAADTPGTSHHTPPHTTLSSKHILQIYIYICIYTHLCSQIIHMMYGANIYHSCLPCEPHGKLVYDRIVGSAHFIFIALWGNKETWEKHVPSSHVSKHACELHLRCYSLLRFCEQLQLDSALSESGAEGCRCRWGSHQWVSLWMRPTGVNGTSSFVRGSHVFFGFFFLFSHPCRRNIEILNKGCATA